MIWRTLGIKSQETGISTLKYVCFQGDRGRRYFEVLESTQSCYYMVQAKNRGFRQRSSSLPRLLLAAESQNKTHQYGEVLWNCRNRHSAPQTPSTFPLFFDLELSRSASLCVFSVWIFKFGLPCLHTNCCSNPTSRWYFMPAGRRCESPNAIPLQMDFISWGLSYIQTVCVLTRRYPPQ